ncbi:MAG: hypothetical protein MJZ82_03430 [Paludibacteraceae bacterium]|nr:hypothetical protein [Paludibacteraceae bacterium]
MIADKLYHRIALWLHRLTAINTGGEGIHSPYLFEIVRMLMYDDNSYYCWYALEERRRALINAYKPICIADDLPDGRRNGEMNVNLKNWARQNIADNRMDRFLFRLVLWLGRQIRKNDEARTPLIIDTDAGVGLTAAYMASADSRNKVVAFCLASDLRMLAEQFRSKASISNLEISQAVDLQKWRIDTLYNNNDYACARADLICLNANKGREYLLKEMDAWMPVAHRKTIFVLKQIRASAQSAEAWRAVKQRQDVTTTMDLGDNGLVFLDPDYIRRHYKLRI